MTTAELFAVTKACPDCGSEMQQRYRKAPNSSTVIKRGGWVCSTCNTDRAKRHRAENPDKAFDSILWSLYRIRLVDYRRMLAEQDYRCAACGKPESECNGNRAWSRLVVDHNHACCQSRPLCGRCVRGLICSSCNMALGHAGDDVERLRNLIAYLGRY